MFEIEALEAILATVNNEAQRCGHTLCTPHNNMSAETPKHRPASMVNNIRMGGGQRGIFGSKSIKNNGCGGSAHLSKPLASESDRNWNACKDTAQQKYPPSLFIGIVARNLMACAQPRTIRPPSFMHS